MKKLNVILTEYGGEEDYIHLLFSGHPNLKMSAFVGNLKTVSSRRRSRGLGNRPTASGPS